MDLQVGAVPGAGGLGRIFGVGPGRGIGFLYLVSNVLCLPIVIMALMSKRLRRVDMEIPDHS